MKGFRGVLFAAWAAASGCSSPSLVGPSAQANLDAGSDGSGGSLVDSGATKACVTSEDCNPLVEFCEKGSCDPSASGVCALRPGMSATYYCSPDDGGGLVCGCDGQTYAYACIAQAEAINVASQGPCPLPDGGGACSSSADCGQGLYCQVTPCSAMTGTCAPEPSLLACEADSGSSLVCGCDHQTYDSACEAASYGVSVDSQGQCPPLPSGPCTSQSDCGGASYAPLVFCMPTTCGSTSGACTPVPGACSELYDPVCGCDGMTYMNSCFAELAHEGWYVSDAGCGP